MYRNEKCDFFSLSLFIVLFSNFWLRRISALSEYYGGWVGVYADGLQEIRLMFPQVMKIADEHLFSAVNYSFIHGDLYPGYQDQLNFVKNSAHLKERMISS